MVTHGESWLLWEESSDSGGTLTKAMRDRDVSGSLKLFGMMNPDDKLLALELVKCLKMINDINGGLITEFWAL